MPYVLLALLLALAAWAWLRMVPSEGRKSALITMALAALIVVFVLIAVTGRLPALLGAAATAIPFLRRVIPGFFLWRWLRRFLPAGRGSGTGQGDNTGRRASVSGTMTRGEALDVLGLKGDPAPEEIRQAHRRLIQKVHPDHGGNDYLAARINEAKAVLIDKRSD